MTAGLGAGATAWRPRFADGWLAAGMLVLAGLWLGPLLPLSRTSFSAHMLLHLGIVVVASPLLGYGVAGRLRPPSTFGSALSWCMLAMLFELVAVWGWHIPLLHDAQGRSVPLFGLEQASFLLAGLGVWTTAFAARTRHVAAAAAFALFLTFAHMTMFGLVLTLAPRLIYDPDICRGGFGLDRLDDQHLGGILMAVGGGLPYLAGTVWACWLLVGENRARSPRRPLRLPGAPRP